MTKYFLVAHTHWDREWHKTFQENRVRLIGFMQDLLHGLETDPQFTCFVLDGQTSLLLDYLDICPRDEERIRRLVAEGRLVVGPWYVQPDTNIPSGEALLRNLMTSKRIADRFGASMAVGYLPDSFGMSADLPTLLSSFGIQSALFYRGLSADDTQKDVFWWEGQDGSRVCAAWMPDGYGNAMFLHPEVALSLKELEKIKAARLKRSIGNSLILMSGSDQCYAKKHLAKLCADLQPHLPEGDTIRLCSPEEYFSDLLAGHPPLEVYKGEMRHGRHSRTHISIGATRMDIKMQNAEVDRLYKHLLEPLCAVAGQWGIPSAYGLVQRGWQSIVENHAHDSICCCCTDEVHQEMLGRISGARQIANTMLAGLWQALHQRIAFAKGLGRPLLLFSSSAAPGWQRVRATVYAKKEGFCLREGDGTPLDYAVHHVKTINLKDTKVSLTPYPDDFYQEMTISFYTRLPGVGYSCLYIDEATSPAKTAMQAIARDNRLENDHLCCLINPDGTLDITDKDTGKQYPGQHLLVDGGNAGDEYDYSPPLADKLVSPEGTALWQVVENTPTTGQIQLCYQLTLPATTTLEGRSAHTLPMEVTTTLTLGREDRFIDFETVIHNTAENHRLQAVFALNTKVESHLADIQLGEIVRENTSSLTNKSVEDGWAEQHYPVYIQQRYMALLEADGTGWMLLNKGLPQYEICQQGTTKAALTLLSAVGMMGNENLPTRPGRRSGAVCPTPNAQMPGATTVHYRFHCLSSKDNRPKAAEVYSNPIYTACYPEYEEGGFLPDNYCALHHEGALILSAYKPAEAGTGTVARLVNPATKAVGPQAIHTPFLKFADCLEVTSSEQPRQKGSLHPSYTTNADMSEPLLFNGAATLEEMQPHQLVSLLFTPQP